MVFASRRSAGRWVPCSHVRPVRCIRHRPTQSRPDRDIKASRREALAPTRKSLTYILWDLPHMVNLVPLAGEIGWRSREMTAQGGSRALPLWGALPTLATGPTIKEDPHELLHRVVGSSRTARNTGHYASTRYDSSPRAANSHHVHHCSDSGKLHSRSSVRYSILSNHAVGELLANVVRANNIDDRNNNPDAASVVHYPTPVINYIGPPERQFRRNQQCRRRVVVQYQRQHAASDDCPH